MTITSLGSSPDGPAQPGAPVDGADFTELFDEELMPTLRRLGERGRGGTEPLGDEQEATRRAVWKGLAGLGALDLGLPDGAGGGPRLSEVAPLAELMGRALYQSPYFDALTAAELIAQGAPGLREELLGAIAAGETTVAVAAREDGRADPARPGPLEFDADRGGVRGTRRFVGFAADVDLLLVVGRDGTGPDAGLTAVLLPRAQAGVTVRRHDDLGRGDLYAVAFDGARTLPGGPGTGDAPPPPGGWAAAWETALARARLRHASYLVGLCLAALELSAGHARRRHVFGQPLAKFQGPAFRLAQLAARTEAVRSMVRQACADADRGAHPALAACQSLSLAGELAVECGAEAIQIHGSYGMTESCDAQRIYRRAIVDSVLWGTGRDLRRQALGHLAGPVAAR